MNNNDDDFVVIVVVDDYSGNKWQRWQSQYNTKQNKTKKYLNRFLFSKVSTYSIFLFYFACISKLCTMILLFRIFNRFLRMDRIWSFFFVIYFTILDSKRIKFIGPLFEWKLILEWERKKKLNHNQNKNMFSPSGWWVYCQKHLVIHTYSFVNRKK